MRALLVEGGGVRAAFAAGASGKKKLNKREQKDARGPRLII